MVKLYPLFYRQKDRAIAILVKWLAIQPHHLKGLAATFCHSEESNLAPASTFVYTTCFCYAPLHHMTMGICNFPRVNCCAPINSFFLFCCFFLLTAIVSILASQLVPLDLPRIELGLPCFPLWALTRSLPLADKPICFSLPYFNIITVLKNFFKTKFTILKFIHLL